jgi:hypothetical protein
LSMFAMFASLVIVTMMDSIAPCWCLKNPPFHHVFQLGVHDKCSQYFQAQHC